MIEVDRLHKNYAGFQALRGISFSVEKGEILGFLGPNGAGKSTTMRILTTFLSPTSGTATVNGFDVVREAIHARGSIGYLPENVPLYRDLRVGEYLKYRADLKGLPRPERKARVGEVIERTGLTEMRSKRIGHLSKGYRQRVGLADALVARPPVLILDEPTGGLDPNQMRDIRSLVRGLAEDHTVILSTHVLPEVEQLCSRVVIINRGTLVADGAASDLAATHLRGRSIRVVLRSGGSVDALTAIAGVKDAEAIPGPHHTFRVDPVHGNDPRSAIADTASRHQWELLELGWERISLEEVFAAVTEETADA
jgi:ABC-2 type transport system ATP-binding protein